VFVQCAGAGQFLLPVVLSWAWGHDGFVIIHLLCGAGRVVVSGGVGLGEYGNALCNLGLGLGLSNFLVLLLPVTVIHLSSFSPSSCILARRQSSPDSLSLLAYPPNLAANLWRGLNATLSSSQIDLKR
jgi:hypothetical protein